MMAISRGIREKLRPALFGVLSLLNQCLPKRDALVISTFPDIEDQGISLLRELVKVGYRPLPDIALLVAGSPEQAREKLTRLVGPQAKMFHVLNKWTVKALWLYSRSRWVIFTHGLYMARRQPRSQTVVNVWHGMPLKRIWRGLRDSPVPPCTWLLSTSPRYAVVLADASGFATAKIPVLGLPRNDLLFSQTLAAEDFSKHVHAGMKRVVLFLPTYRKPTGKVGYHHLDGVEGDNVLAMSAMEEASFRAMLALHHIRVLVKPHPMSVHYGETRIIDDNLWVISDDWLHSYGVTLYEALGSVDALITDVSSVYVDFLALRRPVFFFFPDLSEYRRTRTFLFEPVEDWLAGPLCTTAAQLIEELEQFAVGRDRHAAKRAEIAAVLNPQTVPDAAARLFAMLGWRNAPVAGTGV
jgi:CDP-glycerol glycerophosphotransferase